MLRRCSVESSSCPETNRCSISRRTLTRSRVPKLRPSGSEETSCLLFSLSEVFHFKKKNQFRENGLPALLPHRFIFFQSLLKYMWHVIIPESFVTSRDLTLNVPTPKFEKEFIHFKLKYSLRIKVIFTHMPAFWQPLGIINWFLSAHRFHRLTLAD